MKIYNIVQVLYSEKIQVYSMIIFSLQFYYNCDLINVIID